jgi:hypothetical protein
MKYMCSFYFIYTVFGNRRLTMTTEQRQKNLDNAQAVVDSSSLSDEGDRRIIELGYKPVFKREFGRLS